MSWAQKAYWIKFLSINYNIAEVLWCTICGQWGLESLLHHGAFSLHLIRLSLFYGHKYNTALGLMVYLNRCVYLFHDDTAWIPWLVNVDSRLNMHINPKFFTLIYRIRESFNSKEAQFCISLGYSIYDVRFYALFSLPSASNFPLVFSFLLFSLVIFIHPIFISLIPFLKEFRIFYWKHQISPNGTLASLSSGILYYQWSLSIVYPEPSNSVSCSTSV